MLPTFSITSDHHLVSDLVDEGSPHALHIGDRVTVSRPLDLGYMGAIKTGELGTVVDVEASQGGVEIRMDVLHRGLCAWENCLLIVPFMTEDILDAFCRIAA